MDEARYEKRQPNAGRYSLTWSGRDGSTQSADAVGLDISRSGLGIECARELKEGALVHVQAGDGAVNAEFEVVYCIRRGAKYRIGFEFREVLRNRKAEMPAEQSKAEDEPDYYEILQISRKADTETVHRVFRIMAVRFHPDNAETGDLEQFLRMKRAYAVLSDPDRRAEYNAMLDASREAGPRPIFVLKDFVTGVEAESNRRLGVLSLLYSQRQISPDHPGLSVLDLEREMGFPREYLTFTMWYLHAKDFVTVADNSDHTITAAGADYVEKKALRNEIAGRLLQAGGWRAQPAAKQAKAPRKSPGQPGRRFLLPASTPVPPVS